ncbi:hypothetical protein IUU84_08220 [Kocuria rhizophila]|uniref:DUF6286 domain-containing protein n=1 Tax=Kocuria rhizophila TaxID=72000 RepID=UPI00294979D5|nr:DUF6286 domain-containing protein [Kocuria rhizophila]MDV5999557.1 hypothetical protein [Kocuria rhizophila]
MSGSIPSLRRRPARVIPSVLVCLVILIPVGFLVWAIIIRFTTSSWPGPIATGAPILLQTPVSHPTVIAAAIITGILGLILILCAVLPGHYRHSVLRVDENLYTGSQETVLTHRGLANILRTRTSRLDGVDTVTATVTDRLVELSVHTPLHAIIEVDDRVRTVAQDTVNTIPFLQAPAVMTHTERSR